MTESPSALLLRAAVMIESQAKVADPGPWRIDPLPSTYRLMTASTSPYPDYVANIGNRFSAAWIATMSPDLAAFLVAMLRYEARTDGTAHRGELIGLARAVLGEAS